MNQKNKKRILLNKFEKYELYKQYKELGFDVFYETNSQLFNNWGHQDIRDYLRTYCRKAYKDVSRLILDEKIFKDFKNDDKKSSLLSEITLTQLINYYETHIKKKKIFEPTIKDCKQLSKKQIEEILKEL